jgi:transcription antitermination factor NusG
VRDELEAQGIEQFLPVWEETSRWSDRIAKVTRPLFTGYIFSRCVPTDVLQVLQTRGVCAVLGTDGPEAIPDSVIANLQRIAANPAAVSLGAYAAGETVRVGRGPFAGVTGIITRVKNGATLTIPVQILGRAVSVQIDSADIEL